MSAGDAPRRPRPGPGDAPRPRPRAILDPAPLGFWDAEQPTRWARFLDARDAFVLRTKARVLRRPVDDEELAAITGPIPVIVADEPAGHGPGRAAVAGHGPGRAAVAARLRAWTRDPRTARRAGTGAIGCGIAVFVAGAIVTPLAGADLAAHRAPHARHAVAEPVVARALPAAAAAPATRKTLAATPTHVAKKAPVTHKVITGLAANGIPNVALNAYRVAAARMANAEPSCGVPWYLLAGIGREESDHGRFGGATLHANGISTPPIIGPALDGVHWDYIPAPGNGAALDGDARFAHALGPMQFIPSTWAGYGADATGDHKADIFNINDAALGAARYLCAAGGDLRTQAGKVAAVLAYNHNDQYLDQVLALADAYRRGVPVTGIPVGITKGPLPTIGDTGYIPPVNPGAPTAVDHRAKKHPSKAKTKTGHGSSHGASSAARGGGNGSGGGAGSGGSGGSSGGGSGGGGSAPSSGSSSGSGQPTSSAPTAPTSTPPSSTKKPICIPIPILHKCP